MLERIRLAPPRYWLVLVIAIFFVGLPSITSNYQTFEWAEVLILSIAIMGLNILTGYSGQISLGHGAFMALGAYSTAILVHRYHIDYLATIPIAGLLTGAVGFVFGIPALRLSALYLALATFALAVVTPSLIKRPDKFTGGVQGIILLPPQPPFGLQITSEQWLYYLALGIAAVLFWLAWNLLRHRPGRAFRAIRDSEVAAAASGINLAGYKTLAFGVSAFYAGIAGSLYGVATAFVSPDSFQVSLSILLLVGAVIGGLASLPGPLVGGIFAIFLPIISQQWVPAQTWIPSQIASAIEQAGPAVTYGALLILLMIFAPNGLVGLITSGHASLRKRLRGAGESGTWADADGS
jgi:branched-chain amino acid transport system permease protein